ncbi:MAG: SDR family NAD(P)-dependent oxidoreductase, partial [Planctomycetota bacterium]
MSDVGQAPQALHPRALAGRVAVVTGAGSGIGRATCQALGAGGARVVAVGRQAETLAQTCSALDGRGTPLVADVLAPDWPSALDPIAPAIDLYVGAAASYPPYRRAE